jgi:hypothetical protein
MAVQTARGDVGCSAGLTACTVVAHLCRICMAFVNSYVAPFVISHILQRTYSAAALHLQRQL